MAVASLIHRTCSCGCGRSFTPPRTRPNQQWIIGHKAKVHSAGPAEVKPAPEGRRRGLNYQFALDSAQRELSEVEAAIEELDDKAAGFRNQVAEALAAKDQLVERHLALTSVIEQLRKLVGSAA